MYKVYFTIIKNDKNILRKNSTKQNVPSQFLSLFLNFKCPTLSKYSWKETENNKSMKK